MTDQPALTENSVAQDGDEDLLLTQVRNKAGDWVKKTYPEMGLLPITCLRLPGGFRIPFESRIAGYRVRKLMLILYIDEATIDDSNAEPVPERDDFAGDKGMKTIDQYRYLLRNNPVMLMSPQSAIDCFEAEHPKKKIYSLEPVLFLENIELSNISPVCWRIGYLEGLDYKVVTVSAKLKESTTPPPEALPTEGLSPTDMLPTVPPPIQKPDYGYTISAPELKSTSATASFPGWKMGKINLNPRRRPPLLEVALSDLSGADKFHLNEQWTIWSCLAHTIHTVHELGYGGFNPYNFAVEYVSGANAAGASFSDGVNGTPTLRFSEVGGWASDHTVVLHELGHALWSLLYTTQPPAINANQGASIGYQGIQEGFADYISGMMASPENATPLPGKARGFSVGKRVDQVNTEGFPRLIDGLPRLPHERRSRVTVDSERWNWLRNDLTNIGKKGKGRKKKAHDHGAHSGQDDRAHQLGHCWANVLWDFRQRIGSTLADPIVLLAHFKLRLPVGAETTSNPFTMYFLSLQETALFLQSRNALVIEERTKATLHDPEFWRSLASAHCLP